ncbi:hypothetical protein [uncultured Flavobacterium sp.]|uniref:BT4734/BF3469 family protein n=1 Tax=uncultured Flavobacterium sp. TaxID=165435 RepID=UPI0025F515DC|nr:hypothetical protein [uncultured Flavobacterium sp.]
MVSTTSITNWLKLITTSEHSATIIKARNGELDYDKTKASLPCVTYNFLYNDYKKDKNIISGTGFIYIDIDDESFDVNLLESDKVYAYYKSFGGNGYAIIVKVEGLTLQNFKSTYRSIIEQLRIESYIDFNAIKASQFNVLSYDENIFINENSIIFQPVNKKVSSSIIKKERECIVVNDTFSKSNHIRFNNISDYFTDIEDDYIMFEEKEKLCIPFIPKVITKGKRNSTVFFLLSQYALLNPTVDGAFLRAWADIVNQHCPEKLSSSELVSIINSVLKKREEGTLEPYFNKERRIIFNPKSKLTTNQKQKTTAVLLGKMKTDKTQQTINDCIENWNYEIDGKIDQKKISSKINKSIATIKRNWFPFKIHVTELNKLHKKKESVNHEASILEKIDTKKKNLYSDIKFYLWNGQVVYVPNKYAKIWNENIGKKGLMKEFEKNNYCQHQFDFALKHTFPLS